MPGAAATFVDLNPVKKSTDRKTATTRIRSAAQQLQPAAPPAVSPKQRAAKITSGDRPAHALTQTHPASPSRRLWPLGLSESWRFWRAPVPG
jgi:hypothetical protein